MPWKPAAPSPDDAKRRAVTALATEFRSVDERHIAEIVERSYRRLEDGARTREFVPLLAQREARETLRAELGARLERSR